MNVHCHVQSHKFTCLVYTVKCVHPLHMCFCMLYCRVVQFCFKPRMSGSMCKSSNDVAGNWDDEKQRTTTQTSLDCFFERVDRKKKKASKKPEPVSSSGMSETAACPPSPIADDSSALHFPPPLPAPVSNSPCLFTRCQPCSPAVVPYYYTSQGTIRF